MKNTKKVALYSPYLDILGGGERHILSILKVFDDLGYQIVLIWNDPSILRKIEKTLSISFLHATVIPNFLDKKTPIQTMINTHSFEYFFYVTDGSYFLSAAKRNYIFAMVPNKDLYHVHGLNKLKTSNYSFITNSNFTHDWLVKWGITSDVIYPYIHKDYFIKSEQIAKKDNIILSVGRFFAHLHSKKQGEIIKMFTKYKQNTSDSDLTLHLAGRVDDKDVTYFEEIKKMAETRTDIVIHKNISEIDLKTLYKKATYYWHFAGFGINESKNPEKVEHLGMTPLEAMAGGCITFCYDAGGPGELIKNDETGYLFNSFDELSSQMKKIEDDSNKRLHLAQNATSYVSEHFSYDVFKKKVISHFQLYL